MFLLMPHFTLISGSTLASPLLIPASDSELNGKGSFSLLTRVVTAYRLNQMRFQDRLKLTVTGRIVKTLNKGPPLWFLEALFNHLLLRWSWIMFGDVGEARGRFKSGCKWKDLSKYYAFRLGWQQNFITNKSKKT